MNLLCVVVDFECFYQVVKGSVFWVEVIVELGVELFFEDEYFVGGEVGGNCFVVRIEVICSENLGV